MILTVTFMLLCNIQSKEVVQMTISRMMTNRIFTVNETHTQSENEHRTTTITKTNRTRRLQLQAFVKRFHIDFHRDISLQNFEIINNYKGSLYVSAVCNPKCGEGGVCISPDQPCFCKNGKTGNTCETGMTFVLYLHKMISLVFTTAHLVCIL